MTTERFMKGLSKHRGEPPKQKGSESLFVKIRSFKIERDEAVNNEKAMEIEKQRRLKNLRTDLFLETCQTELTQIPLSTINK